MSLQCEQVVLNIEVEVFQVDTRGILPPVLLGRQFPMDGSVLGIWKRQGVLEVTVVSAGHNGGGCGPGAVLQAGGRLQHRVKQLVLF